GRLLAMSRGFRPCAPGCRSGRIPSPLPSTSDVDDGRTSDSPRPALSPVGDTGANTARYVEHGCTPSTLGAAMSTTEVRKVSANEDVPNMCDLKLEVVVIPVSDVDRSKAFYEHLGWRLDADFSFDNGFRIVQFTPPGSSTSVQFGTSLTTATPGSTKAVYLI